VAQHFREHGIGEPRRADNVGQSARQRGHVGAEPFQAVLAEQADSVAFTKPESIESENRGANFGAEVAPRDLFEPLTALQFDECPVTEFLDAAK
jgi:hypothetical protein